MPTLYVYTSRHCLGCEEARRLSAAMAERFPEVVVAVVDLDEPEVETPPEVFAVPTYVLAGRVLFLGNPAEEELAERLGDFLRHDGRVAEQVTREG